MTAPVVECRRCGVNVYGDDDAHVLRLPFGLVPALVTYCATCWPIARKEFESGS